MKRSASRANDKPNQPTFAEAAAPYEVQGRLPAAERIKRVLEVSVHLTDPKTH